MRGRIAILGLFIALSVGPAVSAATPHENEKCRVVAGEKYLGGGGETLCREVERAISTAAPATRYKAEIKALSPTRLAAILVVNGRALPEHKFAVMDAELGPEAMRRFARSLAADVAKAAKK